MGGTELFCVLAVVFLYKICTYVKTYGSVHQKQSQFLLYVNTVAGLGPL